MKNTHHLKLWIAGALLIPAFFLWKIAASYLLLPIVSSVTDSWVSLHYSKLSPSMKYNEASRAWEIKTNLFQAEKPWSNNTYSPNLHVSGFTFISLGHIGGATLGLPLFWVLITVFSLRRLRNGLIGSAVILVCVCITIILHAEINVITLLSGDSLLRTFQDPYIFIPPKPTVEWLWVLKPLRDLSGVLALLVMPILLCYYFNTRETVPEILSNCEVVVPE